METFILILTKSIPIYLIIILGFLSTFVIKIDKDTIAKLLIYILLPVVVFTGTLNTDITPQFLSISLFSFFMCVSISLFLLFISRWLWNDKLIGNVLSVGIANGNFGFIGIPLTILLLGEELLPVTLMFNLGGSLFIATLGFYLTSRVKFSIKESLLRVLKLPIFYSMIIGIIMNLLNINFSEEIISTANNFTGAYSILGLMFIGIVFRDLSKKDINIKLVLFSFLGTFFLWPAATFLINFIDKNSFEFFQESYYSVFILMSLMPVGASIVALARDVGKYEKEASFIVLSSTIIALVYIPIFIELFL